VSESGSASISVSRAETNGFSAKKTGLGANEADPYSGNSLQFSLDQGVTNNISLNFVALSSSEVLEYDGFDALNDKQDRDTQSMKFGVEFEVGSITNEFEITDGNFDRKYYGSGGSLYQSDRRDMLYKGQVLFNPVSVTFGASSSKENIKTASQWSSDSGSDTELAYFVEASSRLSDEIEAVATARQTNSDDFGSNSSYRAALVYNLNSGVTLRAMGSSGFRAPSLYERYSASYGNKNLKPEESETQEVGAEKVYQDGSSARFTIFNTKVDNLIGSDPNTFAYIQSGDALKSQGVELAGLWKINDAVSLNGNYTYSDAKQGTTVAVRVPKQDFSISVAANISPEITSSLTANHIRDYKDTGGNMPNYTVVNAASSYMITDTLEGYIRFQNLLDSDYETIKDFNTGGRQIFAGIRATF
jgi:vitamin B12 transporter